MELYDQPHYGEHIVDEKLDFAAHVSEGKFLLRMKKYQIARDCFSSALHIQVDDKNCLAYRSQCKLLLGDTEGALADAEASLIDKPQYGEYGDGTEAEADSKDKPPFLKGTLQKAESNYSMGEFEYALIYFHRCLNKRPQVDEFRLGVQKSIEAILNAIGDVSGLKFCNIGEILQQIRDKKEQEEEKQNVIRERQKEKGPSEEMQKMRLQYGSHILLEQLGVDRDFFEALREHPEISGEEFRNEEVIGIADEAFEYLTKKQKFWSQQEPLYTRKRKKKMASGQITYEEEEERLMQELEEKKAKIRTNHQNITDLLFVIDQLLNDRRYQKAIELCYEAEKIVCSYVLQWLPKQDTYLGIIYSALGIAHLHSDKYHAALAWHKKDLELAEENTKSNVARARALDNIGKTHAIFGKFQLAIDAWEQRIPLAKTSVERSWLFHEIGVCYKELNRYEASRFYATKCLKEAEKNNDIKWMTDADHLWAISETHLGNIEEADKHFNKALDLAREGKLKESAKAIQKSYNEAKLEFAKIEKERQLSKTLWKKARGSPLGLVEDDGSVKSSNLGSGSRISEGGMSKRSSISEEGTDSYIDYTVSAQSTTTLEEIDEIIVEPEKKRGKKKKEEEYDEDAADLGDEDKTEVGEDEDDVEEANEEGETEEVDAEFSEAEVPQAAEDDASGEDETSEAIDAETAATNVENAETNANEHAHKAEENEHKHGAEKAENIKPAEELHDENIEADADEHTEKEDKPEHEEDETEDIVPTEESHDDEIAERDADEDAEEAEEDGTEYEEEETKDIEPTEELHENENAENDSDEHAEEAEENGPEHEEEETGDANPEEEPEDDEHTEPEEKHTEESPTGEDEGAGGDEDQGEEQYDQPAEDD